MTRIACPSCSAALEIPRHAADVFACPLCAAKMRLRSRSDKTNVLVKPRSADVNRASVRSQNARRRSAASDTFDSSEPAAATHPRRRRRQTRRQTQLIGYSIVSALLLVVIFVAANSIASSLRNSRVAPVDPAYEGLGPSAPPPRTAFEPTPQRAGEFADKIRSNALDDLFGRSKDVRGQASPPAFAGPPSLSSKAALRPTFVYGANQSSTGGTAFTVRAKNGRLFLVTAAHLFESGEWPTVRRVTLETMSGDEVVGSWPGKFMHVGLRMEDKMMKVLDLGKDFAITAWPPGAAPSALKVATRPPVKDEQVWLVGREATDPGPQKLYACRIVGSQGNLLQYTASGQFQFRGFSGGPLVNASGEVVGTLDGGLGSTLVGATATAIRAKLNSLGIALE